MSEKNQPSCFCAYPSTPASLAETIEQAIELINGTEVIDAISWKSLRVAGRLVMPEICAAIDRADLFLCDLTHLNPNVLFEFGYAVARNKRVYVVLDDSYQNAQQSYKQVRSLTTIGYAGYHNANDIVRSFLDVQPYRDLDHTLYTDVIEIIASSKPS